MQNLSKSHEKNVQTAVHTEQVSNILDNVENTPYALRGSLTKSILYWLFCTIAALELSAALFFYVASLGTPQAVAAVMAGVIGFALHGLLHSLLTDTTKGMVFSKMRESKAMSNEVKTNIVLSIVLLATVALIVFFVGKKGFSAYRGHQYEIAQAEATGKAGPDKPLGITADMLVNKKGKISSDKLEQLAAVTTATAKAADSKTASVTADRQAYDATTAQMTDIVGASAFVLELLLALLAYSIATAKYAAVYDEIARRNGASQPSQQVNGATAQNTPSVTPTNTAQAEITFYKYNDQRPHCLEMREFVVSMFTYQIRGFSSRDFNKEILHSVFEKLNVEYRFDGNEVVFSGDVKRQIIAEYQKVTPPIEPPTAAPITPNLNSFSDNKANEGRAVVKGFQRQNEALTANNEALTAKKQPLTANNESKLKMCLYCEKEFIYRVHNQKYCGEECRICAWNEKLGKQLRETTASVNGK